MPSLEQLHRDLAPRGLRVVAVAVDDPGYEDRVRAFVTRYRLTFEVLSEGSGKIEVDYQSRGIPSTYLIDRNGVIRMKVLGAADWSEPDVRQRIEAVLGARRDQRDGPSGTPGPTAGGNGRSAAAGPLPRGARSAEAALLASNPERGSRGATPARSVHSRRPDNIPTSPRPGRLRLPRPRPDSDL
jgi:hypothetical protein